MTPKEEIRAGIEQGDKLVTLLESYYQQNREYPPTLEQLTPQYINVIPRTISGQEYEYKLLEPNSVWGQPYLLTFYLETKKYVNCSYMERFKDWDCSIDTSDH